MVPASSAAPASPAPASPATTATAAVAPTASAPEPTSFEGAVHFEVEPVARKCYEKRSDQDSRVGEGTVNIRVRVPPQGSVQASDLGSTLNDAKTIDCIILAFSRLSFRPRDGRELDSTVPFTFIKGSE
jgi:hypothetical protein